jgi:hypothetical protein
MNFEPAAADKRQAHQGRPRSSATVYWVGHSLLETKAETNTGPIDIMSLVGAFARSKGLEYEMQDHTLWGASLSALWRGRPHSYERDASSMVERRQRFEAEAKNFDTLVLTEAIPLGPVLKNEYSAYYLRLFYCAIKAANPNARVYLYQTWVNLQEGDANALSRSASGVEWRTEMSTQRAGWEWLADAARKPKVTMPSWHSRLWPAKTDMGCQSDDPIFMVPVGQAMIALADLLESLEADEKIMLANGSPLTLEDLFANPYIENKHARREASIEGPQSSTERADKAELRDPSKPHDDIHPSAIGIYFAALVHFSILYGQSPIGLPDTIGLGDLAAGTLQSVAWKSVISDRRTGVMGVEAR